MVTSFLIGSLVFFVLSLALTLINLAVLAGSNTDRNSMGFSAINAVILLLMITWNILALINN